MTLKQRTFRAVRWTTVSYSGKTVLQLLQVALLARLLTPNDFGIMAIVFSAMALLQIFADAGVSNAIIHFQSITQKELSSLFWLNVFASLMLAMVMVVVSYFLAEWYGEPSLKYLFILIAPIVIVNSLYQQLRVMAQKDMRFSELARVELSGYLAGFLVAIGSALYGLGVFSFIFGALASSVVSCGFAWRWMAHGWRPLVRFALADIRKFLRFGAYMVGNNLANTVNSQIDVLMGGKLLGMTDIGVYTVSRETSLRIAGVINPIITQVGLPLMAKLQRDRVALKNIFLKTIRMSASINFPLYIALGVFAPEVVHLYLGEKWIDAVPLLQIFACWGLVRSTMNPVGSLLLALGRADLSFWWNISLLFVLPPSIWIGSLFGVLGVAIAMATAMIVLFIPNWYFQVMPLCGASLIEYMLQLASPLVLSLSAGFIGHLVGGVVDDETSRLTIGLSSGVITYLILSMRFNKHWVLAMQELVYGRKG